MAARRRTSPRTRKSPRKRTSPRTATRRTRAAKRPAPRTRSRARTRVYQKRRDLDKPITGFLAKLEPTQRAIVERIRSVVRGAVPGVREGLKWGMPVWSRNGLLCYTAPGRGYIRFGFYMAGVLDDSAGLRLEGSAGMPHVKLDRPSQVVEEAFANWARRAAARLED